MINWVRKGTQGQPCSSKLQKKQSIGNYPPALPVSVRTLGEYIRKWRLEQGLLQVDLAKKIKVNEMTIVKLPAPSCGASARRQVNRETGKTKPDKKKFEELRTILGSSTPSGWSPKL